MHKYQVIWELLDILYWFSMEWFAAGKGYLSLSTVRETLSCSWPRLSHCPEIMENAYHINQVQCVTKAADSFCVHHLLLTLRRQISLKELLR